MATEAASTPCATATLRKNRRRALSTSSRIWSSLRILNYNPIRKRSTLSHSTIIERSSRDRQLDTGCRRAGRRLSAGFSETTFYTVAPRGRLKTRTLNDNHLLESLERPSIVSSIASVFRNDEAVHYPGSDHLRYARPNAGRN